MNKTKKRAIFKDIIGFMLIATMMFVFIGIVSASNKFNADNYELVEFVVGRGQSAWGIQQMLTPKEDVRPILHELSIINGKDMGQIQQGDVIKFFEPKNKD